MLTQLATVKARLALAPADITHDDALARVIAAVTRRFEAECRRSFGRTLEAVREFPAHETEVSLTVYPLEAVTRFEVKTRESEGWLTQAPDYLVRHGCVITLLERLGTTRQIGRVLYTGGYVLPGDPDPTPLPAPGLSPTRLPEDLEHAAVEQVAAWFQNRDKLGLVRHWPSGGTYDVLSQQPLLPSVAGILRKHERWST